MIQNIVVTAVAIARTQASTLTQNRFLFLYIFCSSMFTRTGRPAMPTQGCPSRGFRRRRKDAARI